MLGSGGTSPFWAGNHTKTQRKILKAKYTTKIPAFERLSEQIKQLIKRSEETNCWLKKFRVKRLYFIYSIASAWSFKTLTYN